MGPTCDTKRLINWSDYSKRSRIVESHNLMNNTTETLTIVRKVSAKMLESLPQEDKILVTLNARDGKASIVDFDSSIADGDTTYYLDKKGKATMQHRISLTEGDTKRVKYFLIQARVNLTGGNFEELIQAIHSPQGTPIEGFRGLFYQWLVGFFKDRKQQGQNVFDGFDPLRKDLENYFFSEASTRFAITLVADITENLTPDGKALRDQSTSSDLYKIEVGTFPVKLRGYGEPVHLGFEAGLLPVGNSPFRAETSLLSRQFKDKISHYLANNIDLESFRDHLHNDVRNSLVDVLEDVLLKARWEMVYFSLRSEPMGNIPPNHFSHKYETSVGIKDYLQPIQLSVSAKLSLVDLSKYLDQGLKEGEWERWIETVTNRKFREILGLGSIQDFIDGIPAQSLTKIRKEVAISLLKGGIKSDELEIEANIPIGKMVAGFQQSFKFRVLVGNTNCPLDLTVDLSGKLEDWDKFHEVHHGAKDPEETIGHSVRMVIKEGFSRVLPSAFLKQSGRLITEQIEASVNQTLTTMGIGKTICNLQFARPQWLIELRNLLNSSQKLDFEFYPKKQGKGTIPKMVKFGVRYEIVSVVSDPDRAPAFWNNLYTPKGVDFKALREALIDKMRCKLEPRSFEELQFLNEDDLEQTSKTLVEPLFKEVCYRLGLDCNFLEFFPMTTAEALEEQKLGSKMAAENRKNQETANSQLGKLILEQIEELSIRMKKLEQIDTDGARTELHKYKKVWRQLINRLKAPLENFETDE